MSPQDWKYDSVKEGDFSAFEFPSTPEKKKKLIAAVDVVVMSVCQELMTSDQILNMFTIATCICNVMVTHLLLHDIS